MLALEELVLVLLGFDPTVQEVFLDPVFVGSKLIVLDPRSCIQKEEILGLLGLTLGDPSFGLDLDRFLLGEVTSDLEEGGR